MINLLPRKTRAALGHNMSKWDWLAHGWYLMTSRQYRISVRHLKQAFEIPDDPYLAEASKDLHRGTAFDNDGVVDFTPRGKL